MTVELMEPKLDDRILDPAMGSAGFLAESTSYIREHYKKELLKKDLRAKYRSTMFSGYDTDQSILRIGAMNIMLYSVEEPNIKPKFGNRDIKICVSPLKILMEDAIRPLTFWVKASKSTLPNVYRVEILFCKVQLPNIG